LLDFYWNFTGFLEDGYYGISKRLHAFLMVMNIPCVKIPLEIPLVLSTSTPNTGNGF
jgi:hypothetical protein